MVVFAACTDAGRTLHPSAGEVQVIETAPHVNLEQETPVLTAQPVAPELVYLEPLPPPARHTLSAVTSPAGTRSLGLVQSVEVDVAIEGGALGTREVSLVFVSPSPQRLVWQRQATSIDATSQGTAIAHFSLPVAATFIEDHRLFGTWQITSLDEGVELASTTFVLEE